MLSLAREQGEDLLVLKAETPHGEFKERIERETCLSYRTAALYMKVAKDATRCTFDPTAALRTYNTSVPLLTRQDAEYVLKINALAVRGATEGERDSAEAFS